MKLLDIDDFYTTHVIDYDTGYLKEIPKLDEQNIAILMNKINEIINYLKNGKEET